MGRSEIRTGVTKLEQLTKEADLSCPANLHQSFCFIDGNPCGEPTKDRCMKYLTATSKQTAYINSKYQNPKE